MSVRQTIEALPTSRIAEISALGMGDPEVVALWYGEGDLPTPDFIADAANQAMRRGETFYTYKAGLPILIRPACRSCARPSPTI
jgi:aspartate aminotransferase